MANHRPKNQFRSRTPELDQVVESFMSAIGLENNIRNLEHYEARIQGLLRACTCREIQLLDELRDQLKEANRQLEAAKAAGKIININARNVSIRGKHVA